MSLQKTVPESDSFRDETGQIALSAFPLDMQDLLKPFDVDGDGHVSPLELGRAAQMCVALAQSAPLLPGRAGPGAARCAGWCGRCHVVSDHNGIVITSCPRSPLSLTFYNTPSGPTVTQWRASQVPRLQG